MNKYLIAPSYLKALETNIKDLALKGRAFSQMLQFMRNKDSQGLDFEHLHSIKEENFWSFHVTKGYRTIVYWHPEERIFVLVYIDQHTEAYDWAAAHMGPRILKEGDEIIQIEIPAAAESAASESPVWFLPSILSDKDLLCLGVPEATWQDVRGITDKDGLEDLYLNDTISRDAFEWLMRIHNGEKADKLLKEIEEENKPQISGGDETERPESGAGLGLVVDVEDKRVEKALRELSLKEWRVYLHPRQKRIIDETFAGPAYVQGSAGTGKTVTALHRAVSLTRRMLEEGVEGRLLFTFYNKHLVNDITAMLNNLCENDRQIVDRIDVMNIDRAAGKLSGPSELKKARRLFSGEDGPDHSELTELWEAARSAGDPESGRGVDFYYREWNKIVAEYEAFTLEEYLSLKRTGGGKPLVRAQREKVWKVFDEYMKLMRAGNMYDDKFFLYVYRKYVESLPEAPYRHVMVDEAQDFSSGQLRLVRALAGPPHENDLYIVGDPRQRIYGRRALLAECGIDVQDRTHRLDRVYRTTQPMRKTVEGFLKNESFVGSNGETVTFDGDYALRRGVLPQVERFSSIKDEAKWIAEKIEGLLNDGVKGSDICLCAYENAQVKTYRNQLKIQWKNKRVSPAVLADESEEPEDSDGGNDVRKVCVATMHRVKGLEFKHVFIAGMNEGVIPNPNYSNSADELKRARSVVYVALTRAVDAAYVSCSGMPSEFWTDLSKVSSDIAKKMIRSA